MADQAKKQAKIKKLQGLQPSGVSIWSYRTSKQTRWAFEARYKTTSGVVKIQRRGFRSKPECITALNDITDSKRAQNTQNVAVFTFSDLLGKYLRDLEGKVAESTRANYFHLIRLYTPERIMKSDITAITNRDVQQTMDGMTQDGNRAGTINTYRARVSACFNFALKEQWVTTNPVTHVKKAREASCGGSAVSQPWSVNEVRLALAAFEGTSLEVFLHLALFAGLRKGEILALTRKDVDIEENLLYVTKSLSQRRYIEGEKIRSKESLGLTKTESSVRVLPVSASTIALLESRLGVSTMLEDQHLVSKGNGKPFPISSLGKEFKKICASNKVRQIRIHDLRHTAAVLSLLGSAPLEAVSEALGHSSVEVTKRFYAKRVSTFPTLFVEGIEEALRRSST